MSGGRWITAELCAVCLLVGGVWVSAQAPVLPYQPPRGSGDSITGAFEGWFEQGGERYFLVGYFNRNLKQSLNIPVGPNNRIEPGGPDLGQPTYFEPARRTGVFLVRVPKEFTSADQRLTWTLTVNGQTTQIPLRLHRDYNVNPFSDVAVGNTPPKVRLSEQGPPIQGPMALLSAAPAMSATVAAPLAVTSWVDDDGKYSSGSNQPITDGRSPVEFHWSKYRGPGQVTFDAAKPKMEVTKGGKVDEAYGAKATVSARFSEPGDYVLHLVTTDYSGEGGNGEVCCWTNAYVKVTVK
jgi:hypothetical protein